MKKESDNSLANRVFEDIYTRNIFKMEKDRYDKEYTYFASIKESKIKSIIRFKKKIESLLNTEIIEENLLEFEMLCFAYFDSELIGKEKSISKSEIQIRDLLEMLEKPKYREKKDFEKAFQCFDEIEEHFGGIFPNKKVDRFFEDDITENLKHHIDYAMIYLDSISSNLFKENNDSSSKEEIQKIYEEGVTLFKMLLPKAFNVVLGNNLMERVHCAIEIEFSKKNMYYSLDFIREKEAFSDESSNKYIIPDKDFFNLKDLAEIQNNLTGGDEEELKKTYNSIRKRLSERPMFIEHKENSNYSIPREKVINYLTEFQIRKINNKKKNQNTPTVEYFYENFDLIGKEHLEQYENFLRVANSLTAVSKDKAKLNNFIRKCQVEYLENILSELKIEKLLK